MAPKPLENKGGSSGNGSKRSSPPPSSSSAKKNELSAQMEGVLQLLNGRMSGQISTTQVESAVSDLLATIGARKSVRAANESRKKETSNDEAKKQAVAKKVPKSRSCIVEDEGNYDDSSSDDDNDDAEKADEPKKKKARISKETNDGSSKESGDKKLPAMPSGFATMDEYHDAISQIPMGKEAAKMMTTFGDGPNPLPDPLELALMGTRKALQVSIMDARKVRRRLQKDYREAQSLIKKYRLKNGDKSNPTVAAAAAWALEQEQRQQHNEQHHNEQQQHKESSSTPTKKNPSSPEAVPSESNDDGESGDESDKNETSWPASTPSKELKARTSAFQRTTTANSIDPRLVYRALAEGTDKLSYAHKCGFHMEELTQLYPEEMRSYQRWNEMHEEYSESKADEGNINDGDNADNSNNNKEDDDAPNSYKGYPGHDNEPNGGHLRERAANFDYRTDKMKDEWYVEYAKVRQGSFLPSMRRVQRTKVEIEWDQLRKKMGRHKSGAWENINGRAVRFLHWLGFDPPNLFPPDEETTQALAFLAYDRLGRIVEKAIFLRNENDEKARSLWELPTGEQLTVTDIERALEDPDIKPATVYGTEDLNSASSVQLYFGPGWEDRLELEMEEMVASLKGSNHQISEEERMVRNHEMELLTKMSAPPGRDGDHLEILVKNHKDNTKGA